MFRREDYWPYMIGAFLLGGLVAVPVTWRQFIDMDYDRLIAGSVILCGVFLLVHTRTGGLGMNRVIGAMLFGVLVFMASIREWHSILYLNGGLLGFAVLMACGWVGIFVARATGISEKLVTPDPAALQTYDAGSPSSGRSIEVDEPQSDYSFGSEQRERLLARTCDAWKNGELAWLSPHFKTMADSKSLLKLDKMFFGQHVNAIAFAFKRAPPDEDEFLICANDGGVRLSSVLTNKYFYFFGLDDDVLANKYESGKIPLEKIRDCEVEKGLVFARATLTLESGTQLKLRDADAVALGYLARIIAEDRGAA